MSARPGSANPFVMTAREVQVLLLRKAGWTNGQIAIELGCSKGNIERILFIAREKERLASAA